MYIWSLVGSTGHYEVKNDVGIKITFYQGCSCTLWISALFFGYFVSLRTVIHRVSCKGLGGICRSCQASNCLSLWCAFSCPSTAKSSFTNWRTDFFDRRRKEEKEEKERSFLLQSFVIKHFITKSLQLPPLQQELPEVMSLHPLQNEPGVKKQNLSRNGYVLAILTENLD